MIPKLLLPSTLLPLGACATFFLASCARMDMGNKILVSVRDQKMMVVKDGQPVKSYPISTSKFGIGDRPGSKYTPLGTMRIARKIGEGAPSGAVFKSRRRTGEILRPNSPGRDPIVSRILWLKGTQKKNRNAYRRFIYIHGTPEEWRIGIPASYGCIRMKSRDIIDLYRRVGVGAEVKVIRRSLFPIPPVPREGHLVRRPAPPTPASGSERNPHRAGPPI